MKLIGKCLNIDDPELGISRFVRRYNAKPTLVNKKGDDVEKPNGSGATAVYLKPGEYFEQSIFIHRWSALSLKTISSVFDKCPLMNVALGLVVEGKADDELDEEILGCVQLNRVDFKAATVLEV